MITRYRQQPASGGEEAFEILAFHGGDALEALRTLIAERDAVEERLAIAMLAMNGRPSAAAPGFKA